MDILKHIYSKKLVKYLLFRLSFFFSLTICLASSATMPETATITKYHPQTGSGKPWVIFGSDNNPIPVQINFLLKKYKDSVLVPKGISWVNLQFKFQNQNNALSPIIKLGADASTHSKYSFPCKFEGGAATIGWGLISKNGCRFVAISSETSNIGIKPFNQTNIAQTFYKQLTSSNLLKYCSATETSGSNWGLNFSFDASADPCQKAIQECIQKSSGNECSPVSFAEEFIDRPNLGSLQCTLVHNNKQYKRIYTSRKNANLQEELDYLKWKAETLNRDNCALIVYETEDLIVSPVNDELTLIELKIEKDGNIIVDVLVGEVTIISAKKPWGLNLPEGLRYSTNQDNSETLTLKVLDCPKILQSSSIQDFLNPNHWLSPVQSEIDQYRRNFCQTSPEPNKRGGLPFSFSFSFSGTPSNYRNHDRAPVQIPSIPNSSNYD